ncbi:hypothetical protein JKP88DRAFT_330565 [Tribonema minus]|uniref:Uncharacterized protein n=1 Tax=Tribonema minus TaxID=303371 RepID=A0A836C9N2_9STRA|nr:hypothetical protein JKP88DRAFT_330565 [Tribonema minus]
MVIIEISSSDSSDGEHAAGAKRPADAATPEHAAGAKRPSDGAMTPQAPAAGHVPKRAKPAADPPMLLQAPAAAKRAGKLAGKRAAAAAAPHVAPPLDAAPAKPAAEPGAEPADEPAAEPAAAKRAAPLPFPAAAPAGKPTAAAPAGQPTAVAPAVTPARTKQGAAAAAMPLPLPAAAPARPAAAAKAAVPPLRAPAAPAEHGEDVEREPPTEQPHICTYCQQALDRDVGNYIRDCGKGHTLCEECAIFMIDGAFSCTSCSSAYIAAQSNGGEYRTALADGDRKMTAAETEAAHGAPEADGKMTAAEAEAERAAAAGANMTEVDTGAARAAPAAGGKVNGTDRARRLAEAHFAERSKLGAVPAVHECKCCYDFCDGGDEHSNIRYLDCSLCSSKLCSTCALIHATRQMERRIDGAHQVAELSCFDTRCAHTFGADVLIQLFGAPFTKEYIQTRAQMVMQVGEQQGTAMGMAIARRELYDNSLHNLRNLISRDVLTNVCPNDACRVGWEDFDACVVLKCKCCKTRICALCNEKISSDFAEGHEHAMKCKYNSTAGTDRESFYLSAEQYKPSIVKRKCDRFNTFMDERKLTPAQRQALFKFMASDLNEQGMSHTTTQVMPQLAYI